MKGTFVRLMTRPRSRLELRTRYEERTIETFWIDGDWAHVNYHDDEARSAGTVTALNSTSAESYCSSPFG